MPFSRIDFTFPIDFKVLLSCQVMPTADVEVAVGRSEGLS